MKIETKPEINKNIKGTYGISATCGYFTVKRIKDVNNYFFKLENQANDYLKVLIQISSELELITATNIRTIDRLDISRICKYKYDFYERLKYLTFYTFVVALFKMNALYRMTNTLLEIAILIDSKKHIKILKKMDVDFFTNQAFYIKEKEVLILKPNDHVSKRLKTKSMLSVS